MKIPSQIMDFRAYNGNERLFGTGNEITLPSIINIDTEVDLPSGKINVPSMRTENMELEIPFMLFDKEAGSIIKLNKVSSVIIRSSTQKVKTDSHDFEYAGMKYTFKGFTKEVELGTLTRSDKMDSKVKMNLSFIEIMDNEGNEILYIDKLNDKYRVNGEDIREGIDQYL